MASFIIGAAAGIVVVFTIIAIAMAASGADESRKMEHQLKAAKEDAEMSKRDMAKLRDAMDEIINDRLAAEMAAWEAKKASTTASPTAAPEPAGDKANDVSENEKVNGKIPEISSLEFYTKRGSRGRKR